MQSSDKQAIPRTGLGDKEWLEYIPGAAYMTDAQGYIVFCNEAAIALWGRSPALGKDRWSGAYRLYTIEGVPLSPDQYPMAAAVREGREIQRQELILERPDGSKRLILPHPKPILDNAGAVIGGVNIVVDLTDSKKMEEWSQDSEEKLKAIASSLEDKVKIGIAVIDEKQGELKQSEERYHKMISEVEDYAILLLDNKGIIQNWNMGAEKIKGYKDTEIVGRHFRIFYTPSDQEAHLPEKLMEEAAVKGKAIHEGWRQRKDGTLFWGSIVITALHDPTGAVIGFSKVTRDLTARRIVEEKLRRSSQDLEFQNRELQQFAYAAAHDMKEPLRKLRYYNTALLESTQGRLSQKETQYLERATDAATRMQTLIDDLLAYSKASTERGAHGPVDLNEVVADARLTFQDMIDETKAVIEVNVLPVVWGITFQLRQLFENLLGNALKYQAPGRSLIVKMVGEKVFSLPAGIKGLSSTEEGYFKITVQDNGIGFEREMADKIFDIFQRLDSRGKFPGTGIGLAICKRVIQNHRGYILAEGMPGEGARFTMYLPVVDPSAGLAEG